ncbi:Putative AC9 transposase [Frankliniella fusca]|uniref:AC9 transposase n=1 Tax=Frankliniella fusca TaxID=407009 RepID=A0AAE1I0V6_9NEOP|nr:Putative AC9 transposase [Frankliniella fusca]
MTLRFTVKFEKEKEPTIQHVVPQYYELKDVVSPNPMDNDLFRSLKGRLANHLEDKLGKNIDMHHLMAAFLWPKWATLGGLSELKREEGHASVRRLMAEQAEILARRREGQPQDAEQIETTPTPAKRMRSLDSDSDTDEYSSLFSKWAPTPVARDELDKYLTVADPNVKSSELLEWWKNQSKLLPTLSRVARKVLGTPASSSASERRFGVAGRLITNRRNRLSPQTVFAILVLHDYVKKRGQLPPIPPNNS